MPRWWKDWGNEKMNTVVDHVLRYGKETPDALALAFKDRQVTYGALCKQMCAAARQLKERYHISAGDRVALSGVSSPEFVFAYLGIQFIGAVSVAVDKSGKENTIRDILSTSGASLFLSDTPLKEELPCQRVSLRGLCAELANADAFSPEDYHRPNPDALSEIIYTSGTTGKSKGVMLSCRGVEASNPKMLDLTPADRMLNALPLHHIFAIAILRAGLRAGAAVILQNGFSYMQETEKNLRTYRCTVLYCVPATMEFLYRNLQDRFAEVLGGLRYIYISAGSLSVSMKKTLHSLLPNTQLANTFGCSECGTVAILYATRYPDKLGSLGRLAPGIAFKAVDAEGNEVKADSPETAGRLTLKGPSVMMGYYGMPEQTAKALSDGWLCINDLVWRDADGFLYMLGRSDDMMKVGGEKVFPAEVETAAADFEEIRECGCIGIPDPAGMLGQVPILFVVPEHSAFHEDQCKRFLMSKLEQHKIPQRFIVVHELPRNRMQKVDRAALLALYEHSL